MTKKTNAQKALDDWRLWEPDCDQDLAEGMSVHRETIRTALQSRQDETAQKWQSMSTAPKDGTKIIVLLSSGYVKIVYWDKNEKVWMNYIYAHNFSNDRIVGWILSPPLEEDV